jgi:hypothetical protein
VSEWLRRWTRNPLGSARRGSNPLGVVFGICAFAGIRMRRCIINNLMSILLFRLVVQLALLAQWLERAAVNRKVTGSIPVGSVCGFAFNAFLNLMKRGEGNTSWFCGLTDKASPS